MIWPNRAQHIQSRGLCCIVKKCCYNYASKRCMSCAKKWISSLKRFPSWTSETTTPTMSQKTPSVLVKLLRSPVSVVKKSFKSSAPLFVMNSRSIKMSSPISCPMDFPKNDEIKTMQKSAIVMFAIIMLSKCNIWLLKNSVTVSMHPMCEYMSDYTSNSSWYSMIKLQSDAWKSSIFENVLNTNVEEIECKLFAYD